jgi:hypothetical protein
MRCRKWLCWGVAWVAVSFAATGVSGQEFGPPGFPGQPPAVYAAPLEDRVQRLERQNEELRQQTGILLKQNQTLIERLGGPTHPIAGPPVAEEGEIRSLSTALAEADEKKAAEAKPPAAAPKAPPAEEWSEVGKNLDMTAVWRYGLWVESKDKAFRIHPGGRLQTDFVWLDAEDNVQTAAGGTGNIRDGVNFRRGRLALEGTFYEVVDFNTEWDFINTVDVDPTNPASQGDVANTPVPTDCWVQLTQIPFVGTARVGNMKTPISFEHLTSSRFLPFMERSLGFDASLAALTTASIPGP